MTIMKWITFALIVTFVALQYQIWVPKNGLHHQYAELRRQNETMQRQNADLRDQNRKLRAEVQDLNNGFEAIAEIARHNMGHIQDGEIFYSFKP